MELKRRARILVSSESAVFLWPLFQTVIGKAKEWVYAGVAAATTDPFFAIRWRSANRRGFDIAFGQHVYKRFGIQRFHEPTVNSIVCEAETGF